MPRTRLGARAVLAAPFVVTIPMLAIGCAPPAFDTIVHGSDCSGDATVVNPANTNNCGLNGYRCEDGKWNEMMTSCNPPPADPTPVPEVPPAPTASSAPGGM